MDVERVGDDEMRSEMVTVPHDMIRGAANYVVRVSGDVLECEHMRDGNFLIVSPCTDAQQAQYSLADGVMVLCEIPDVEGQRVRRLTRATDDSVCLEIGNSAGIYPAEQVRIVGVIVGIIRRY